MQNTLEVLPPSPFAIPKSQNRVTKLVAELSESPVSEKSRALCIEWTEFTSLNCFQESFFKDSCTNLNEKNPTVLGKSLQHKQTNKCYRGLFRQK